MSVFRGCDFGDTIRVRVVVAVTIQRPQRVVCTGLHVAGCAGRGCALDFFPAASPMSRVFIIWRLWSIGFGVSLYSSTKLSSAHRRPFRAWIYRFCGSRWLLLATGISDCAQYPRLAWIFPDQER